MSSPRVDMPDRTAHRPLEPFTVDHFVRYGQQLVLDSGDPCEVEDFQVAVMEDLFAGVPEVWEVVPEANGKTTLMGLAALYYGDYTVDAAVLLGAASRDQCGLLLGQAAGFVHRSPGLERRFKVFKGYRRIECLRSNGTIQVHAADERTGDGVIPGGLVLLDELHRHRDMGLYRTWRGKLGKRGAQLAAISTAGEPASEFENIREEIKRSAPDVRRERCYVRAASPQIVLHDYSVPSDGDIEDMELVKEANPFSLITPEKLRKKRNSPTMSEVHWRRFVCNQAARVEEFWIEPDALDACVGVVALQPGQEVVTGIDLGKKKDSTATVTVGWVGDKVHVQHKIRVPLPDHPILVGEARADVAAAFERFQMREAPYDPWQFSESAESLEERGVPMVEFPQSTPRMAPASETLYELINAGRLVWDGDPEFRRQLLAAVPELTDRGVKMSKKKSKERIDAAVATAMAVDRLLANGGSTHDGPLFEVL